jgi:hypothetical protein
MGRHTVQCTGFGVPCYGQKLAYLLPYVVTAPLSLLLLLFAANLPDRVVVVTDAFLGIVMISLLRLRTLALLKLSRLAQSLLERAFQNPSRFLGIPPMDATPEWLDIWQAYSMFLSEGVCVHA